MSRNLTLSIVATFRDRVSGALGGIQRRLAGIKTLASRIGVMGGVLSALSFAAPLQSAAAYEGALRDIAITSNLSGKEATAYVERTGKAYNKLALEVGQSNTNLAKGAGVLVAAGMDTTLTDELMPTIGKVSTAANAEMEDTAKTAFALSNTLKIPAERMEASMGKLITLGKEGRFEFKDMAKAFPELTSQMSKLGMEGEEALTTLGAGLQVAMYGTDSPDIAANNFKNFLSKISSPEVAKQFAKAGVDITKVMADATAKGINPVEAVIQKLMSVTKIPAKEIDAIVKKAQAEGKTAEETTALVRERVEKIMGSSEVGQLFRDQQVLDFLTPFLANIDKYKEMKEKADQAGAGVINQDFATRMEGKGKKIEGFMERLSQLQQRVGDSFAANLDWATSALDKFIAGIDWLDAQFPGMTGSLMTGVGALLMLGAVIGVLTPVISALAAVFAVLFSPIGAVIALLAVAGAIIYKNWDEFAPYFQNLWNSIKTIFQGAINVIAGIFTGDFGRVFEGLKQIFSGYEQYVQAFFNILFGIFKGAIKWLDESLGTDIWGAMVNFADQAMQGLDAAWEGIKSGFGAASEWLQEKINTLLQVWDALSNGISNAWDALKGWIAGNEESASALDKHKSALEQFTGSTDEAITALSKLDEVGRNKVAFEAQSGIAAAEAEKSKTFSDLKDTTSRGWFGAEFTEGRGWTERLEQGKMTLAEYQSELQQYIAANGQYAAEAQQLYQQSFKLHDLDTQINKFQRVGQAVDESRKKAGGDGQPTGGTIQAPPPVKVETEVGGRIVVSATPGTTVVNAASTNPTVPIAPDRGTVVGRP